MIAAILFAAVEQIRAHLQEQDRFCQHASARGFAVVEDPASRADVYTVLDQMERLARRLVVEAADQGLFLEIRR
jgi:hypothetical protein